MHDAIAGVIASAGLDRLRLGHTGRSERTGAVGRAHREHPLPERLALAGRLPDLGEVVPLEVDIAEPGGIAHPRAHEIGTQAHEAHGEAAAPVVPDEVDRLTDGFELGDEPGGVVVHRRAPSRRDGRR